MRWWVDLYLMLLSTDPEVRRRAFLARTEAFDKIKNTNAAVFSSSLKKDHFLSRARKYNSTLEMALDADNVPVEVYDNLINTVYNHVGSLNRYMELRKKVLNLDEIHLYDTAVPIVEDVDVKVPYEEAKATLLKANNARIQLLPFHQLIRLAPPNMTHCNSA